MYSSPSLCDFKVWTLTICCMTSHVTLIKPQMKSHFPPKKYQNQTTKEKKKLSSVFSQKKDISLCNSQITHMKSQHEALILKKKILICLRSYYNFQSYLRDIFMNLLCEIFKFTHTIHQVLKDISRVITYRALILGPD